MNDIPPLKHYKSIFRQDGTKTSKYSRNPSGFVVLVRRQLDTSVIKFTAGEHHLSAFLSNTQLVFAYVPPVRTV